MLTPQILGEELKQKDHEMAIPSPKSSPPRGPEVFSYQDNNNYVPVVDLKIIEYIRSEDAAHDYKIRKLLE